MHHLLCSLNGLLLQLGWGWALAGPGLAWLARVGSLSMVLNSHTALTFLKAPHVNYTELRLAGAGSSWARAEPGHR
jgi:hypothetical protein